MLTLRPATENDVPVIAAISRNAFWSNFPALEPGAADHPGYRDLASDRQQAEALDLWPGIWIAEFDGLPGGWGARAAGGNEITEMWVHSAFQGKGAGTALIGRLLGEIFAEGHHEAWIETHLRNTGAIRLYQRMGFVPGHQISRPSRGLGRDIPLIRMCLALAGING